MKTSSPFIWGIIFFCTMDDFFRMLEKRLSELICTRLCYMGRPKRPILTGNYPHRKYKVELKYQDRTHLRALPKTSCTYSLWGTHGAWFNCIPLTKYTANVYRQTTDEQMFKSGISTQEQVWDHLVGQQTFVWSDLNF